jgi:hypothetical protein
VIIVIKEKVYTRPVILSHQPVKFETRQSWNKGHGNLDHPGTGNGGIHYPNDPYTGPQQDDLNKNKDKGNKGINFGG